MANETLQFLIPARTPVESLKSELLQEFALADVGESQRRRLFYDTFDWRLFRHSLTLEEEQTDHGRRLVMRDLDSGAVQRWVDNVEMPRLARELSRGPFRERLLELTAMRALLPVAELRSHTYQLRLRDKEEKTVARIELELAALNGDARVRRLPKRFQVLPVRGHPEHTRQLTDFAAGKLALPPATSSLLEDALAAIGQQPAGYSNKPAVQLDPAEPAQHAIRRILASQLKIIEINVPGTCQYVDTEHLHDLRVAVRRTRSLLGQFRKVLPEAETAPFRQEFAWLGTITGPCRDLDVHLLDFDSYQARLKPSMQPALEPVRRYLVRQHSTEQRRLREWLASPRFRALLANWQKFIDTPDDGPPEASRPVRELADAKIRAQYQTVLKRGRSIGNKTADAKLHKLRIHTKKLRYLTELFRELYPDKQITRFVTSLKRLQQNLGEFHDYCIQIDALGAIADDMAQKKLAGAETMKAIKTLTGKLEKSKRQARRQYAEIFSSFDEAKNRKKARQLFHGKNN
ncbi:MAG: CHAD domain-containing protein [Gammaproteobacteria bacterium]|nr:CHAD domain-containing protein [Gammaproteobacteria bacterium]NNF62589.1 CHAD domain-containing protein [Gammaproteobacteria bacterium]NNM19847.1 CHAD domain-containing protein [Gammaproteobacteria bacterium]